MDIPELQPIAEAVHKQLKCDELNHATLLVHLLSDGKARVAMIISTESREDIDNAHLFYDAAIEALTKAREVTVKGGEGSIEQDFAG